MEKARYKFVIIIIIIIIILLPFLCLRMYKLNSECANKNRLDNIFPVI